jgi:hypothetical protein
MHDDALLSLIESSPTIHLSAACQIRTPSLFK